MSPVVMAFALAAGPPVSASALMAAVQQPEPKQLIQDGRFAEAREMLLARTTANPADVEAHFLLGLTAVAEGQYDEAVAQFRIALSFAPDQPRIRLELARALYLAKDYDSAVRQFQRAVAGKLPPEVEANVRRFISAIRREKSWSYHVGVSVAPDTNINGGSSSRETILFGLPFELGDDARRKSGIGLSLAGGVEHSPHLSDHVRLRLGAAVQRREYGGRRFDDMAVNVFAGPRLLLADWDVSLVGTGLVRWYGGRTYQRAGGASVEVTHYPSARSAISGSISAQHFAYPNNRPQSGTILTAGMAYLRAFSPSSLGSVQLQLRRQTARSPAYSNWTEIVAGAYSQDLKGGYTVVVQPTLALARYDAADPFFARKRKDRSLELGLSLLNRRINLWRFNPSLTYTFADRRSTIDLYDSRQHRLEFGLTSEY